MKAFPPEDHAAGIQDLDLSEESTVLQRSLGLCWEIASDAFTFQVSVGDKPFTRRGVLSTINSVFDPLGLASPVTVQGRALLRELTCDTSDWDAPLPEEKRSEWVTWRDSLLELKELHIPRTYTPDSLSKARRLELCVFSDASTKAIGAVAYLRAINEDGNSNVRRSSTADLAPGSTYSRSVEGGAAGQGLRGADPNLTSSDFGQEGLCEFTELLRASLIFVYGYRFNELGDSFRVMQWFALIAESG